jgi:hypothetical protein
MCVVRFSLFCYFFLYLGGVRISQIFIAIFVLLARKDLVPEKRPSPRVTPLPPARVIHIWLVDTPIFVRAVARWDKVEERWATRGERICLRLLLRPEVEGTTTMWMSLGEPCDAAAAAGATSGVVATAPAAATAAAPAAAAVEAQVQTGIEAGVGVGVEMLETLPLETTEM